eukprot:350242-Chlamydomonas_euryale.AAC.13
MAFEASQHQPAVSFVAFSPQREGPQYLHGFQPGWWRSTAECQARQHSQGRPALEHSSRLLCMSPR